MIKRKILAIGIIATLCLSMVACATNTTEEPNKSSVNTEVENTENKADEKTDVIEDEIDETTKDSTDVVEPGEEDIVIPGDIPSDATIDKVFEEVRTALGDEYFLNVNITAEYYELMYGVNPSWIDVAYGEMPMISVHPDFLIAIKPVKGHFDDVKNALEAFLEMKKNDMMQYPTTVASMPAATVVTVGDYVFAVATFGDSMVEAENGDEAILAYVQKNVDKVVDIIKNNVK